MRPATPALCRVERGAALWEVFRRWGTPKNHWIVHVPCEKKCDLGVPHFRKLQYISGLQDDSEIWEIEKSHITGMKNNMRMCLWVIHCVLDSCLIKKKHQDTMIICGIEVVIRVINLIRTSIGAPTLPVALILKASEGLSARELGSFITTIHNLKYGCVWKLSILRIPGYPWNDNFSWEHDFQPLDLGLTYTIQTLTENHSPLGKKYRCLDKRMKDLFSFW